ncbi:MAG: class I SAM-dependent methyltransferase [Verrucomicrobia bacterium]|nr:class I SAM-dependent methyltransferase [Verrucomicrobiota bacterium]
MSREINQPVKQRRTTDEAARNYVQSRDPKRYKRTAEEEGIVRGWLKLLPKNALLFDCPCGVGRFVNTALEMGLRYAGGDVAVPMIQQAMKVSTAQQVIGFAASDAEHLPLGNNSVDCVMLWRLLHHIPDEAVRKRMFREAARVSRGMVLVSFHHPLSFTFLRRLVNRVFTSDWEISDITHWRLRREAAECGLEVVETKSFGKFVSINWFAYLRKIGR